jgi:hypothetical protein
MDAKLEKLSQMLDKHYRSYTETFIDEETGKEEVFEHEEIINRDLSDEERQLIEMIAADVPDLSNEDLFEFQKRLIDFKYRAFDEIYIELVRRGEEDWASSIKSPATLQELSDKGNKYAAWELYWKHYDGDEEHGIFIDRKRAREYYDLALERGYELYEDGSDAWDDSDDPGEEYPSTYEYVLTGNAETLDGVETLIRDLCKRFGIPENEEDGLGLFVPQRMLMKVLVGSDTEYYRGNIQYLEREAPARLVITTEADKGEPLLYALRQCFDNLTVEMKELEW